MKSFKHKIFRFWQAYSVYQPACTDTVILTTHKHHSVGGMLCWLSVLQISQWPQILLRPYSWMLLAWQAYLSSASPASKTSKDFASAGPGFPCMSGWALQPPPKETHFTLPALGLCNWMRQNWWTGNSNFYLLGHLTTLETGIQNPGSHF